MIVLIVLVETLRDPKIYTSRFLDSLAEKKREVIRQEDEIRNRERELDLERREIELEREKLKIIAAANNLDTKRLEDKNRDK